MSIAHLETMKVYHLRHAKDKLKALETLIKNPIASISAGELLGLCAQFLTAQAEIQRLETEIDTTIELDNKPNK